jgi:hypothetical protein
MKDWFLRIKEHTDDLKRGDIVYHNHELLRVEGVSKERGEKRAGYHYTVKFRRIGRINLDRQRRDAEIREEGYP